MSEPPLCEERGCRVRGRGNVLVQQVGDFCLGCLSSCVTLGKSLPSLSPPFYLIGGGDNVSLKCI